MNLKERGVTVGDLLIIAVIIISTFFVIDKVKDSDNQSQLNLNHKEVSTPYIM